MRAVDAIDEQIGMRVRLARKSLGLSQSALGERLGITAQQLQKYEMGANRISASRLHRAARAMGLPVSFFFPGEDTRPDEWTRHSQPLEDAATLLGSAAPMDLIRAFCAIEDPKLREHLLKLIRAMAKSSSEGRQ